MNIMDSYAYHRAKEKKMQMQAKRYNQKAMEPQVRHCYILDKDVNVLVEYPYYKNPNVKGPEGEIYCENIMKCFQNRVECRWSGISPHYPDPFAPRTPRQPHIY